MVIRLVGLIDCVQSRAMGSGGCPLMHRLEGGAFGSKLVQLMIVTHGVWKVLRGIEIEK